MFIYAHCVIVVVVVEASETCQSLFDQELGVKRHHKHSEHIEKDSRSGW